MLGRDWIYQIGLKVVRDFIGLIDWMIWVRYQRDAFEGDLFGGDFEEIMDDLVDKMVVKRDLNGMDWMIFGSQVLIVINRY